MGEEGTAGCMVGVDGGNEEKEQDQMSKSIRAHFVRERGMEGLFLSKGEQLSVTTEAARWKRKGHSPHPLSVQEEEGEDPGARPPTPAGRAASQPASLTRVRPLGLGKVMSERYTLAGVVASPAVQLDRHRGFKCTYL